MNFPRSNGGGIDVTYGRILIAIALLLSITLLVIFTEQSPYILALVNLFGIAMATLFAKDSVEKNRATKDVVDKHAQAVEDKTAMIERLVRRNLELAEQTKINAATAEKHAITATLAATESATSAESAAVSEKGTHSESA